MSKSQIALNLDKVVEILKCFPSEPFEESSIIKHDQGGGGISLALCGSGTVTDWEQGRKQFLISSNVGKCMTVAIATLERGLLLPMALTSQERIDQDLNYFRTWWSENKDSFTNGRLFVVMPDWAEYADAYAKAHALHPEVEKLTNLKAKVTNFHKWPGDKARMVWFLSQGTEIMPKVICNNKVVNPAVPLVEDNSKDVQEMWEQLRLSS